MTKCVVSCVPDHNHKSWNNVNVIYNTNIRLFDENPLIRIVDKSQCTNLSIIRRFHSTISGRSLMNKLPHKTASSTAMQEAFRLRFHIQRLEGLNFTKFQLKDSSAKGICFYSPVLKKDLFEALNNVGGLDTEDPRSTSDEQSSDLTFKSLPFGRYDGAMNYWWWPTIYCACVLRMFMQRSYSAFEFVHVCAFSNWRKTL